MPTAHRPPLTANGPPPTVHSPVGHHLLLEFSGCEAGMLNDVDRLERCLVDSCRAAGATVVKSAFHAFSPIGASGVVVIAESHVTVHTWPEHGYAALDIFTCGELAIARGIEAGLHERMQPSTSERREFCRQPAESSRPS